MPPSLEQLENSDLDAITMAFQGPTHEVLFGITDDIAFHERCDRLPNFVNAVDKLPGAMGYSQNVVVLWIFSRRDRSNSCKEHFGEDGILNESRPQDRWRLSRMVSMCMEAKYRPQVEYF